MVFLETVSHCIVDPELMLTEQCGLRLTEILCLHLHSAQPHPASPRICIMKAMAIMEGVVQSHIVHINRAILITISLNYPLDWKYCARTGLSKNESAGKGKTAGNDKGL